MTEKELRQKVVSTAEAWLGTREYSDKHYEMLDIYNAQSPLPRGTRMQATWPWCAMFVSVVSLQCGLRGIMPTECGCPSMVRVLLPLGITLLSNTKRYTIISGVVLLPLGITLLSN